MPQLAEDTNQQAHGSDDTRIVALHRLKDQCWQRAGQRLQAAPALSKPRQTTRSPGEQPQQPSSTCSQPQQAIGSSVQVWNSTHHAPQKQLSPQQLAWPLSRSSQHCTAVLHTAVKGMQSRPPSRMSSASVSLNSHLHQHAGKLHCIPGGMVEVTASTGSQQQSHVSMSIKQQASMSPGTNFLEVHGARLVRQQALPLSQHKARKAAAGRMKESCVPEPTAAHPAGSGAGGSLGCGIPWVQFKQLATAVHKRGLHHSQCEHQRHR